MVDFLPQVPAFDREPSIWTFQDAVSHILDYFDVPIGGRHERHAITAVVTALRDLANSARWTYYDRRGIILTAAQQKTGTIAYDFTGGTNERELTLTGATWPTDARFYRIIIGDRHYGIENRISSTVVTLDQRANPGADVAAVTAYTLYRAEYPLPADFRRLGRLYDVDNEREIPLVTSDEGHLYSSIVYDEPDVPLRAALRNDGERYGMMSLLFSPPPSGAVYFDFQYEGMPQALRTYKYSTGTVTTNGTTTITGTSTVWTTALHAGCVMRFSANTTSEPTTVIGTNISGTDTRNPFTAQGIVQSVTNGTTIVLDRSIATLTAVKYTLSDPVDVEPHAMYTAFLRMAEAEFARLVGREDQHMRGQRAQNAVMLAREFDQRTTYSPGRPLYDDWVKHSTIGAQQG